MTFSAAQPEADRSGSAGQFDPRILSLISELENLKIVYRRSYVIDQSRKENSAEHSWQLALTLLIFHRTFAPEIDIDRAIRMALVHDIAEIGAGDVPVYSTAERAAIGAAEGAYLAGLVAEHQGFAHDVYALWQEFEEQKTLESRWVKVGDRILPILLNLATEGRTWRDLDVAHSQVTAVTQTIAELAPPLYEWMQGQLEMAVSKGWLKPG